ncbi:hypothetical protein ACE0DR_26145 [Azotobacter sp. CWF10]
MCTSPNAALQRGLIRLERIHTKVPLEQLAVTQHAQGRTASHQGQRLSDQLGGFLYQPMVVRNRPDTIPAW